MPGIYIHIPFCKQACHYCDFHFSTSLKKKDQMTVALATEIRLRKHELEAESVDTIYFGGGTPSVLSIEEIDFLIDAVYLNFDVSDKPEITLEANPDDLSREKILELSKSRINRLSIGIQSFFDEDLRLMNRAHNASEAKNSLALATQYFDNITIDLIYGIPGMDAERWLANIETALSYDIPHISAYALTVEPKTPLHKMIAQGNAIAPKDEVSEQHFNILAQALGNAGFEHYELSNFGKPGYFSRNNSAYWLGKKYIGIGPSAHSFDGKSRSWNVSNNSLYLKSISVGELPSETETLTLNDRYNEYVMTGLRTVWGVSIAKIESDFGSGYALYLMQESQRFVRDGLIAIEDGVLKTTQAGKFLADGIASALFKV